MSVVFLTQKTSKLTIRLKPKGQYSCNKKWVLFIYNHQNKFYDWQKLPKAILQMGIHSDNCAIWWKCSIIILTS